MTLKKRLASALLAGTLAVYTLAPVAPVYAEETGATPAPSAPSTLAEETPEVTETPAPTAAPESTEAPTQAPTAAPTEEPPQEPTPEPEAVETPAPTAEPAAAETPAPTETPAPREDESITPEASALQYGGSSTVAQMNDGIMLLDESTNRQDAYNAIVAAMQAVDASVDISAYSISINDMQGLFNEILNSNPQLFYVDITTCPYSYNPTTSTTTTITLGYTMTVDEAKAALAAYETKVQDILSECITDGMSNLEKALVLHDYLAQHISYDTSLQKHNAYNALMEGSAVCQGYSLAYYDLLKRVGISAQYVSSDSMNHEWNAVLLDGSWYHVDVTWDDPVSNLTGRALHDFFMKSDDYFKVHKLSDASNVHEGWNSDYCTSTTYDASSSDTAFWYDSDTAVVVPGTGEYYYITVEKGSSGNYTTALNHKTSSGSSAVASSQSAWEVNSQYWPVSSMLSRSNGKLYFNDSTHIYCYDPTVSPATTSTIYTQENTGDGYIKGCMVAGSTCTYTLAATPNDAGTVYTLELPTDPAPTPTGLAIDAANFPDEAFRSYVSDKIDTVKNGYLSDEEIAAVREIDVSNLGIADLTGLANFTNVYKLICSNNKLTALDVSALTGLKYLSCGNFSTNTVTKGTNTFTTLDLSKNTVLDVLYCQETKPASLDLSNNKDLTHLNCNGNLLTKLEISDHTKLVELYCSGNQLGSLDVSKLTELTNLGCNGCGLSTLDVSNNTKLTNLYCASNSLTSLDLSAHNALENLDCAYNKLAELKLPTTESLTLVTCNDNQLTALDLSGLTKLKNLLSYNNKLLALDLSQNTVLDTSYAKIGEQTAPDGLTLTMTDNGTAINLKQLQTIDSTFAPTKVTIASTTGLTYDSSTGRVTVADAANAPTSLTYTYATGATGLALEVTLPVEPYIVPDGVAVNATNFPDATFRNYVSKSFDTDGNGYLSDEEIAKVTAIRVINMGITSMTGLQYFTSVTELDCSSNALTELDVTALTELKTLYCGNNITDPNNGNAFVGTNTFDTVDLSQNTKLDYVMFFGAGLKTLDVSNNLELTGLNCARCNLTTLNVSKNTKLETLFCYSNNLGTLDIRNNTALTKLSCAMCGLTELDLTHAPNLTYLECSGNDLKTLNVTPYTQLATLYCIECGLTELDLTGLTKLKTLTCSDNYLTALDLGDTQIAADGQNTVTPQNTRTDLSLQLVASDLTDYTAMVVLPNTLTGLNTAQVTPAGADYYDAATGKVYFKDTLPTGSLEYTYNTGVEGLPLTVAVPVAQPTGQTTVTLSGITVAGKTYNGTAVAPDGTLTAKDGTTDVTAHCGTPTYLYTGTNYSSADAPTRPGDYKLTVTVNTLFYTGSMEVPFTIEKANLTWGTSDLGVTAKNYDGTTYAAITGTLGLNGVVGTDEVTVPTTLTGKFDTKNAGTGKTVTLDAVTLTGADAGNYNAPTETITLKGDIGKANLTWNTDALAVKAKTYDGTTAAEVTGTLGLNDAVSGDDVSVSASVTGTFIDKNADTDKTVTVTVSAVTLTGADAGNYNAPTGAITLTGSITKAALTWDAADLAVTQKVYDGSTDAAITGTLKVNGVLAGDTVTVPTALTGSFDTKNVGTGKTVTLTPVTLTGADAANYTTPALPTLTGTVTQKALSWDDSGLTVVTKTYDGGTDAAITGTLGLDGLVSGDDVAVHTPLTGKFDNKKAGTGKTVTLNPVTLTGADAGNYNTPTDPITLKGTINKAYLTWNTSAMAVTTKTYDGNNSATITGSLKVDGIIGNDEVTVTNSATGTFADKKAGTGKTVTLSEINLGGADMSNYDTTNAAATLTGTIEPRALTWDAADLAVTQKVYDGSIDAAITGTLKVNGVLAGDTVTVPTALTGSFDTKNVGTGKTVTLTPVTLTGADAANYTTPALPTLTGTVTQKALSWDVSGLTVVTKTYDGGTDAAITGTLKAVGVEPGDTVTVPTTLTGKFDTKNAGTGKTVTLDAVTLTGADAANYTTPALPTLTGVIAAKVAPNATEPVQYPIEPEKPIPSSAPGAQLVVETSSVIVPVESGYTSPEQVEEALRGHAEDALAPTYNEPIQFFAVDVTLKLVQGNTETTAEVKDYFKDGLPILIDWASIGLSYDEAARASFNVTHMRRDGTMENLAPVVLPEGLQVILYSLSPVSVSYYIPTAPVETTSPDNGSNNSNGSSGTATVTATATPAPTASQGSTQYIVCEACGHHDWVPYLDGYKCTNCGHLRGTTGVPAAAGNSNTAANGTVIPRTSDDANPALWLFLCLLGAGGLVTLVVIRRKRSK